MVNLSTQRNKYMDLMEISIQKKKKNGKKRGISGNEMSNQGK